MRTGVTLDDVTRAADALLERGERPTVEGVRGVLGTGSPATVNAHLKDYFKALPSRLHLPAPIALAASELFEKIRATAQAAADEREQAGQAMLALAAEQLAADRTAFEHDRERLREQVGTLSADLATARETLSRLQELVNARQDEIAALTAKASAAESRAQSAAEERERASQNHHSEIARLKERADGNERHLLSQVEELRSRLKRLQADRDREGQQTAKRMAEVEGALAIATDTAAALRRDLATRDAELAHARHALSAAQAALEAEREIHHRESAYLQERTSLVARERDEAVVKATQMQTERDRHSREAAVLAGRCEALEDQLAASRTPAVAVGAGAQRG